MSKELILKKIEQMKTFLQELARLLERPLSEFIADLTAIRAAERNFQLIVDLASDINTQLLLDAKQETPDTYKQSFLNLTKINAVDSAFAQEIALSASLRNILVHEYDFEEDYKKFYQSATSFLPLYQQYISSILAYLKK